MKTLKITPPKGFEIDKDKSTFESIVFKEVASTFQKIFEYHKTTEKEFEKLYKNIPQHVKAYEKECMLAAYYNKGWAPNWQDLNEYKHYPYFYMDEFRLACVVDYYSNSFVPARLLWKNEKDLKEAIELFPEIFKQSRTS